MSEKLVQLRTFLTTRGKGLSLLVVMVIGVFFPQAHRYSFLIQHLLMVMLFFAFLDIDLKPRPSQKGVFWILLANLSLAFAVYALLAPFNLQLALAGFLTAISPTAISSPVMVGFVEGDMEFIIASVILTNISVALVIPLALPALMGAAIQISAFDVLQSVAIVMFVPLLLTQVVKKLPATGQEFLRKGKSLSMPLWLITLFIVSAKASDFLRNENTASLTTLGEIALISLVIAILNFGIGVWLGRPDHWRESGQALGQKNLSFTIWVALTFVNPLVAMGPTFYIIYHHIYNSWLIYQFEKTRSKLVETKFFIVMGVSGCGKTTLGKAMAECLGWEFYDADDFHPPENVAKMASGIPLNDDDRYPWLMALHNLISNSLVEEKFGVLACSALKKSYRKILLKDNENVQIVYLKGSFDLILSRMQGRDGHYMKAEMLQSQFDVLEEPTDAIIVPIFLEVSEIVEHILGSDKE